MQLIKLFSALGNNAVQVVSAFDDKSYKDVTLKRTIFMIQMAKKQKPFIVDLFKVNAFAMHQYDLPFNYLGTVISTNSKYHYFSNNQTTLGNKNGYQYLWKVAEAKAASPLSQFTFLNNNAFYTVSALTDDSAQLYFTRIGANDSSFNLRNDPAYILREHGANKTFVNVIETHGNFNPTTEIAVDSYSSVKKIELIQDDTTLTIANILIGDKSLIIIQCNKDFNINSAHSANINDVEINWTGPYSVLLNGNKINN